MTLRDAKWYCRLFLAMALATACEDEDQCASPGICDQDEYYQCQRDGGCTPEEICQYIHVRCISDHAIQKGSWCDQCVTACPDEHNSPPEDCFALGYCSTEAWECLREKKGVR